MGFHPCSTGTLQGSQESSVSGPSVGDMYDVVTFAFELLSVHSLERLLQ